ncbi:MAG: Rne/Rng family ribonuclease [Paracoccaceae bacterium]
MAKKMLIDATHAEETRVVVVDGNKVEEFDFESENRRQLAGNIYLAKVTRVEPSLQAAFVDYGGNRHGFLAFSEIHPDYYQIPVADREALMEEERAYAEAQSAREEEDEKPKRGRRRRTRSKASEAKSDDAVATKEVEAGEGGISGMETIDLDGDETAEANAEVPEGTSPMETVSETPVEEPADETAEHEDHDDDAHDDDGDEVQAADASDKDESIESVADEDDSEDIRPVRKPRPRRYKIQEVIKVRQIILVQVVKEERGNKGAALTTYLSLAGRYCVLMPNTARGGGISRKITSADDRKKLKEIAQEIDVPKGAGLIVRTAGAKRTKSEIKRDYEYLQRMWEQIRELTLKSIAPAKIYEEGDLIKRSIRDLYNREIDEVFVEGERGYRIAKDFMRMIMPSHAKNVKRYVDSLPLFARYQVESYLSSMFNPTVQLKSGGYIVIGVTEALVAIDVNSGRATKEGSIEETATKTNLEAAEEVARQLRLRDLAGLIVIDFIDMDERRNNAAVEKRMKDKLKTDRARIQVGRISGFGLMEMSRQRLRPGMIEATTQPCPSCHGTGLIRSDDNLALSILRQIEEEGTRRRTREVLVKCPVGIANFLMNHKREHVAQIEGRYGMSVRVEGDPMLISPDFTMEKFKTATRVVAEIAAPVVSVDTTLMDQIDEDAAAEAEAQEALDAEADAAEETGNSNPTSDAGEGEERPKKRRRRRRRRSKNGNGDAQNGENGESTNDAEAGDNDSEQTVDAAAQNVEAEAEAETQSAEEAPKPKRTRKPRAKKAEAAEVAAPEGDAKDETPEVQAEAEAEKPKRRTRTRKPKAAAAEAEADAKTDAPAAEAETAEVAEKPKPKRRSRAKKKPEAEGSAQVPAAEAPAPEPAPEAPVQAPAEEPAAIAAEPAAPVPTPAPASSKPDANEDADKPKRKGWWSLSR